MRDEIAKTLAAMRMVRVLALVVALLVVQLWLIRDVQREVSLDSLHETLSRIEHKVDAP